MKHIFTQVCTTTSRLKGAAEGSEQGLQWPMGSHVLYHLMPEGGFGQTWWGRCWQRVIYKARWAAVSGSWAISPFTVGPCGSRSKWIFVAKPCLAHLPSLLFSSSQNARPHAARVLDQKAVLPASLPMISPAHSVTRCCQRCEFTPEWSWFPFDPPLPVSCNWWPIGVLLR